MGTRSTQAAMTREDQSEVAADRTVADGWRSGLGRTLGNVDFQSAASVISQDVFRTGGVRPSGWPAGALNRPGFPGGSIP